MLPGFDGSKLDDLIDFLTYTCLPLPCSGGPACCRRRGRPGCSLPLVASAYGFCQVQAKTEDHYFLGFPSYWNVVALYVYLLRLPAAGHAGAAAVARGADVRPDALPLPEPRRRRWSLLTNVLGCVWLVALLQILWRWTAAPRWLVVASLAFPAYYMVLSWVISIRLWRGARASRSRRSASERSQPTRCRS